MNFPVFTTVWHSIQYIGRFTVVVMKRNIFSRPDHILVFTGFTSSSQQQYIQNKRLKQLEIHMWKTIQIWQK